MIPPLGASGTEPAHADRPDHRKSQAHGPGDAGTGPDLALVVVLRGEPRELEALTTVSPTHQRGVSARDYEVLIVAPEHDEDLGGGAAWSSRVGTLGENFRYVRREESARSPIRAAFAALSHSRADVVGLMLEGAALVTPRVVRYALDAFAITHRALVTVPTYELTPEAENRGRRADGYGLFELVSPAGTDGSRAFELPTRPACFFLSAEAVPGFGGREGEGDPGPDPALRSRMCRALIDSPDASWFILPGEGAFVRPFGSAGDASPGSPSAGSTTDRRPVLLGAVTGPALPFVEASARCSPRARDASSRLPGFGARPSARVRDDPGSPEAGVTVYAPPSMRRFRPWRPPEGGWGEVVALAYDLVEALRPRTIVGVGVGRGPGYFSYCQSVSDHGLSARCYAVGSWDDGRPKGDADALHHDFQDHNRYRHAGFSYPLRATYAEAAESFGSASVDLVHLAAALAPERLAGELGRWWPKLAAGGVLVCCDVGDHGTARRAEWTRLAAAGSQFLFGGEPRLGVLRKPGGSPIGECPLLVRILFGGDGVTGMQLRAMYARITRCLELDHRTDLSSYGKWRDALEDAGGRGER